MSLTAATVPQLAPGVAPAGGITKPPPNPITGKPYRPGERLERQARKFAKKQVEGENLRKVERPRRDYEALIARALEELELAD